MDQATFLGICVFGKSHKISVNLFSNIMFVILQNIYLKFANIREHQPPKAAGHARPSKLLRGHSN